MNRYYQDSGALFRNTRRRGDKDPEFRGEARVAGKDYWIAAWQNKSREGKPYLKILFTEKEPPRRAPGPPRAGPPQGTRSAYPPTPAPQPERVPGSDDEELFP